MEGGGSEEGKFRVGLVWENARTPKTTSRCLEITLGQGSPVANGSACWPSQPTKRRRGDKHGEPAFLPEARYPSSGVPLPPLVGRRQGPWDWRRDWYCSSREHAPKPRVSLTPPTCQAHVSGMYPPLGDCWERTPRARTVRATPCPRRYQILVPACSPRYKHNMTGGLMARAPDVNCENNVRHAPSLPDHVDSRPKTCLPC